MKKRKITSQYGGSYFANVPTQLSSGVCADASDVIKEALVLHELYRNIKIEELRGEIAKGWDGMARQANGVYRTS